MNSHNCDVCNVDIHRTSYATFLKSENYIKNVKEYEMILPEWLFRETIGKKYIYI